jgi:hypothetical protein
MIPKDVGFVEVKSISVGETVVSVIGPVSVSEITGTGSPSDVRRGKDANKDNWYEIVSVAKSTSISFGPVGARDSVMGPVLSETPLIVPERDIMVALKSVTW